MFGIPLYCSMAVAVLLSTEIGASMKGLAAMKYRFGAPFARTRTLVVCPGAIKIALLEKGFVYTASISTTVMLCPAIAKNSSSLSAALMILKRYVFPCSTSTAYVSARHQVLKKHSWYQMISFVSVHISQTKLTFFGTWEEWPWLPIDCVCIRCLRRQP